MIEMETLRKGFALGNTIPKPVKSPDNSRIRFQTGFFGQSEITLTIDYTYIFVIIIIIRPIQEGNKKHIAIF